MARLTDIRSDFKFGVQTLLDGKVVNLYQGQQAIELMNLPYWPQGTIWSDRIPVGGDEHEREVYLANLKRQYPTLRFVLMAYNVTLGWFVVPDKKSDCKWVEFVDWTLLWEDKEKIMKNMVGI